MTQKPCYGPMFPETLGDGVDNGTVTGKVFGYDTAPRGLAVPKRIPNVDTKEWEDCLQCEAFDSCYKLSSAKFALLAAIDGPIQTRSVALVLGG
jgi:hypothetical protein